MENDKWICAVCGRKNTGKVCVQCNNPKGAKAEIHFEDFKESDIPPINENENHRAHNNSNNQPNESRTASSNNKNEMYIGIIAVLFFTVVFLMFKIYSDSAENNNVVEGEVVAPSTAKVAKIYTEKKEEPPKPVQIKDNPTSTEPPEIINAKNENQKAAIQALYNFHKNITEHNLGAAYDIFSPQLQNQIAYEGWSQGFSTTVSSTPSNVEVINESDYTIVLTYNLQAVDNPGSIQNFKGTVTLIKIDTSWKIDDIYNKVM